MVAELSHNHGGEIPVGEISPRSMARLNALKAKTEASSYAEVVKNALRLYEALIEETESGKQFLVRDQDGVVSPFRLFL
jgi:hypothetical protein